MRLKRSLEESSIFLKQSSTRSRLSRFFMAMAVIPTMPFMGVRISWDMLERKRLLARLAPSAVW